MVGINESSTCNVTNTSSANEPLFGYIWHIKNTDQYFASTNPAAGSGVDLCMGNLWASGINGNGVKINVVDSGLEIAHEDLVDRIISGASYNFLNLSTDPTRDPTVTLTTGDHGTSVAGLIAATSGNGIGGAGVAPQARLMGYNLIAAAQSLSQNQISFGANTAYQSTATDIFNNSNGAVQTQLLAPNTSQDTILTNLTTLRSGKGAIHIKSAGNNFTGWDNGSDFNGDYTLCREVGISCQNINQDRENTVYNTIVVAALGADGSKSSYSTAGSALWVSGFGGEYGWDVAVVGTGYLVNGYKPAMLTTDQSDCFKGYSWSGEFKNRLDNGNSGLHNASCNYTAGFNGTSSSAPTVSGVVALMLQANPDLTWRDVRHILASTSRRVNPASAAITAETLTLEQGWVKNGAGFWYHNWYGFGLVNAAAAVAMAQSYAVSLGTFTAQEFSAELENITIPSGGLDGLTKAFSVTGPTTVEQAELTLYFGTGFIPLCTQIELSSPRGTKSILLNMGSAHTGAATTGVRFLSNAFYGESAAGTWTLRFIKDDDTACTSSNLSSTTRQALTIRGRN